MKDPEELGTALSNRTISEICRLLQDRGLSTDGRKPVLVERLKEDALEKGYADQLLETLSEREDSNTAPPENAVDAEKRMLDRTEKYIEEHLKGNKAQAQPQPGDSKERKPMARAPKAAKAASPAAERSRGRDVRDEPLESTKGRHGRGKADERMPLMRGGRQGMDRERSRSRDRSSAGHTAHEPEDSQTQSLRKLANDLGGGGLRETLKLLDDAIIRGDVGPVIMADLEAKLNAAIDLIEAQRDTEAAQQ